MRDEKEGDEGQIDLEAQLKNHMNEDKDESTSNQDSSSVATEETQPHKVKAYSEYLKELKMNHNIRHLTKVEL